MELGDCKAVGDNVFLGGLTLIFHNIVHSVETTLLQDEVFSVPQFGEGSLGCRVVAKAELIVVHPAESTDFLLVAVKEELNPIRLVLRAVAGVSPTIPGNRLPAIHRIVT